MITPVPIKYFHLVWDSAREHLLRFEKRTGCPFTVDEIGEAVLNEEQQLWILVDEEEKITGAIVTQVLGYPRGKSLEIMACAGKDMDDYLYDSMSMFEDFARTNGCDSIRLEGRRGWSKILKPYGFEEAAVVLERKI
tara:strand:- start:121 stop:531 length:411 start_codon:yes stop_codon:yes gene_type:complete